MPRTIILWRRISKAPGLQLGAPVPPICGLFVYNLNKSAKASVQPTQSKRAVRSEVRGEASVGGALEETTWKQLKPFDIIFVNGSRYVDKNFGWPGVERGH